MGTIIVSCKEHKKIAEAILEMYPGTKIVDQGEDTTDIQITEELEKDMCFDDNTAIATCETIEAKVGFHVDVDDFEF